MKENLRNIKIIYASLIIGVILFIVVLGLMAYMNLIKPVVDYQLFQLFVIISNLVAATSISSGIILFNKRKKKFSTLNNPERLEVYKSIMIVRAATIEGSLIFFLICFFITANYVPLSEAIMCLTLMIYLFPNNVRISNEAGIDINELEEAA